MTRRLAGAAAGVSLLTLVTLSVACGGSDPAPSLPTTGSDGVTIAITASGVSPKTVSVSPGTQITFVNNDTRIHQMSSDPHPEHTDCPEINFQGQLSPGERRQTGNLNTVRNCGFHDHLQNANASLQGTITIR